MSLVLSEPTRERTHRRLDVPSVGLCLFVLLAIATPRATVFGASVGQQATRQVQNPADERTGEAAEIVDIAADTGGLRFTSSAPVRGVSAMTDEQGRPQILIAGHHTSKFRVHRFADGWIESIEERSDQGDGIGFVRLILTTRHPVRYRLETEDDTVWLQLADLHGEWIPIGSGKPIQSLSSPGSEGASVPSPAPSSVPSPAPPSVDFRAPSRAPSRDSARPAAAAIQQDFEPIELRATRGVNVRARPSGSQLLLGSLEAGEVVLALERRWGWVRISFEGNEGWVYGRYLKAVTEAKAVLGQPPRLEP